MGCHCEPLMVEYKGIETQRRSNLLFEILDSIPFGDYHVATLWLARTSSPKGNDIFLEAL